MMAGRFAPGEWSTGKMWRVTIIEKLLIEVSRLGCRREPGHNKMVRKVLGHMATSHELCGQEHSACSCSPSP